MDKPTHIADPAATLISLEQRVAKLEEKPAAAVASVPTVIAPETKPEPPKPSAPESGDDDAWFGRWFGGGK